jgi:hypothetical protein
MVGILYYLYYNKISLSTVYPLCTRTSLYTFRMSN